MPARSPLQERIRGKEVLRLSREERDHIAGHALGSIHGLSKDLGYATQGIAADVPQNRSTASNSVRKIAALSNLLGDIGWERETISSEGPERVDDGWFLGELFPVAQLRPWLEEWQRQDDEACKLAEETQVLARTALDEKAQERHVALVAGAQAKLGTGAILLARLEKWMASRGN